MGFKVLLINPRSQELTEEMEELQKRGLHMVGVSNFADAMKQLREDWLVHVVLSECELPIDDSPQAPKISGADIFSRILKLRYEVNTFLYTQEIKAAELLTGGIVNGYFYKGDRDFDDIVRKVRAEVVSSKNRAPFFEKLVEYAEAAKDAWHTPGHSSGYSVKNSPYAKDYYDFFGEHAFTADVSVSVPQLDSLMQPRGVIKEAQDLAARAFSARYTFFSTNGTSTSNKILLQTLLKPGDAVLLDRNCHKSVHYGVIIAGAEPLYLMPSVNNKYGIFGPIPKKSIIETMDRALAAGKKLKVLILTNCTYDGLIYDIADVVAQAHARKVKVIVDEAWFGYARFHPEFFPCAMEAGADYATQSTHKTMSAFSQASMIQVADPEFEQFADFFMENFCMHTSTSPQYPMIASLDVARKQMVMEGYGLLQRCLDISATIRESINSLKRFRVLELDDLITPQLAGDKVRLDRTKLTIDVSRSGFSSHDVEHILLTKHNIQIEKSTFNTITILITIGSTFSKLNRLFLALENIEKMGGQASKPLAASVLDNFELKLSPMRFLPRAAFYVDGEHLPLRTVSGRYSASMVTPYPPGIPLLVPGQLITPEIIETLQTYRDLGVEIHGLHEGIIKVLSADEEKDLTGRGYAVDDLQ